MNKINDITKITILKLGVNHSNFDNYTSEKQDRLLEMVKLEDWNELIPVWQNLCDLIQDKNSKLSLTERNTNNYILNVAQDEFLIARDKIIHFIETVLIKK